ncbi:MAG: glycosyltransferase family 2 protein [Atopobiaceae bacterium]|nr:glycosyltransferase family 2 protein [Atopobiaceae bacterium]
MRVLVVIPAYNEEQSILAVVDSVRAAGYDYVVINDGSTDGTLDVCREHGINVVSLPQNLGIGGAVQTGHIYAFERGYDVDIQMDGDGQHDVAYIPRLVEAVEGGSDLVIGSRFLEQTDGFQSTRLRRAGITWIKGCIRRHTGLTITDATSGFRASGRRALKLFSRWYPSDYPEPESIVYAHGKGLVVSEVPVVMHERQGGHTSISPLKSVYYMIKVTCAIAIEGFAQGRRR